LNILFDGPYQSNPNAGVLLYFNLLAKDLTKSNLVYFSRTNTNKYKRIGVFTPVIKHYRPHKFFFYLEYIWFHFFGPKHFDIVHTIEHSLSPTGRYFIKKGAKHVITIYDLIHERFGAAPNLYNKILREKFYKECDGLLFISNSTKQDFKKFYPNLFNYPNSVTYLASKYTQSITPKSEHRNPNFLYVGSREGYKNFKQALEIFSLILSKLPNAKLIVCGSPPTENEQKMVNKIINSLKWICFPSDYELKDIFLDSFALLYTSNYEGFGLPLLEAMSNGCVPVASDHSSIPEVMGNAGIFLDNDDVAKTAKVLIQIFQDTKKHEIVLQNGFEQASKFSWSKTASETIRFYKSLLEK
jgi:glycosyltransferase involved in cell wall biosynthesis